MFVKLKSSYVVKRNNIWFIFILLFFSQCKKEKEQPIILETTYISNISATTAMGGGRVFFSDEKQILSRGICWDTTPQPTIENNHSVDGKGNGSFNSVLTDLVPDREYFVRSYAKTEFTIHYASPVTFTSSLGLELICEITVDSVVFGSAFIKVKPKIPIDPAFTNFGVCWGLQPNPTIESSFQLCYPRGLYFHGAIEILPGVTHYFRPVYQNIQSPPIYGEGIEFISNSDHIGKIEDVDGNRYGVVLIGNKLWLKENLKTTRYNDGEPIPMVSEEVNWYYSMITPAFCWYQNDAGLNKETYGALYNWYAVKSGKLCPQGWSVSSLDDWQELTTLLGGWTVAGGRIKDTGTIEDETGMWSAPNQGATNLSNFTAIPAGGRFALGKFLDKGDKAIFWTTTRTGVSDVWIMALDYRKASLDKDICDFNKKYGFSVRCVFDAN